MLARQRLLGAISEVELDLEDDCVTMGRYLEQEVWPHMPAGWRRYLLASVASELQLGTADVCYWGLACLVKHCVGDTVVSVSCVRGPLGVVGEDVFHAAVLRAGIAMPRCCLQDMLYHVMHSPSGPEAFDAICSANEWWFSSVEVGEATADEFIFAVANDVAAAKENLPCN